jgi:TPR repeat protein
MSPKHIGPDLLTHGSHVNGVDGMANRVNGIQSNDVLSIGERIMSYFKRGLILSALAFVCGTQHAADAGAEQLTVNDDASRNGDVASMLAAYARAADAGNTDAMFRLGEIHDHGVVVAPDMQRAIHYYDVAAKRRHPLANFMLGTLYHEGRGVEQDLQRAEHYYRIAAELGDGNAQAMLGSYYESGSVVQRDLLEAWKWYDVAVRSGQLSGFYKIRDILGAQFTNAQLKEAKLRSAQWQKVVFNTFATSERLAVAA